MSCSNDSSGYNPSSIVTAFHDIPHFDIDFKATSSQFDTTLSYFEAIIIWGVIPVIVCICLFILMTVYHVCVCCCCCCNKEKKPRPKAMNCGCAFFIILLIIFSLGLIGAGLYAEFSLNSNVIHVIQQGAQIDDTVDDIRSIVNGLQVDSYNSSLVNQTLTSLSTDLPPEADPDIRSLLMFNQDINETINMDISGPLGSLQISDTVSDLDYYEEIRHWSVVGYFILIAVILLIVAVVSLCLSPNATIVMIIIMGVITLTVWIVVGGALSLTIVLSDICHDPDQTARSFFNESNERAVVDFYITCELTCSPFTENIGEVMALVDNATVFVRNIEQVTNDTTLMMKIQLVDDSLQTASEAVTNVSSLLNCIRSQGIHQNYRNALDSACNHGFLFVIILLCIMIGLAISLVVISCCQSCFAGLLISTLYDDDDDFSSYDVPQGSTWGQRRTSYTEPYANEAFSNEEYRLTGLSRNATIEPPKFTTTDQGRPTSGEYDHFDT